MIDLYTWMTDNGYKGRQAMEESGLPYKLHPVNAAEARAVQPRVHEDQPGPQDPGHRRHRGAGRQERHAVRIRRDPEVCRHQGGATGFTRKTRRRRSTVDQWLFYGSATFTTLAQQFGHWVVRSSEDVPPAKKFYTDKLKDMLSVARQAAGRERLCRGRRLHGRRYLDVSRRAHPRHRPDRARRVSQRQALARRHRRKAGRAARLDALRVRSRASSAHAELHRPVRPESAPTCASARRPSGRRCPSACARFLRGRALRRHGR